MIDKSSIYSPLENFETIISKSYFKDLRTNFVNEYWDNSTYILNEADKTAIVTYFDSDTESISTDSISVIFLSKVNKVLSNEKLKSLGLVSQYFGKNFTARNEFEEYLNLQVLSPIERILHQNKELVIEYPILLNCFKDIVSELNFRYFQNESISHKLELSKDIIDYFRINRHENTNSDLVIVSEIFGFMSGVNEKRQQILNVKDYEIMIDYINNFVLYQTIPDLEIKLNPNITAELLRFCFRVLHKELYTTKSIRENFFVFMKTVFSAFEKTELGTLRTSFSKKNTIHKDEFLPNVILKHL